MDTDEQAISELPCASVAKRDFMQNLSYEDEFDLHEHEPDGGTHFQSMVQQLGNGLLLSNSNGIPAEREREAQLSVGRRTASLGDVATADTLGNC